MADARHRPRLRREPVAEIVRLERRVDEFDRDPPIEADVLREEDDAHRTAAERTKHAVNAVNHRARLEAQGRVVLRPGLVGRLGPVIVKLDTTAIVLARAGPFA